MPEDAIDDVIRLCQHADMDPRYYKGFDSGQRVRVQQSVAVVTREMPAPLPANRTGERKLAVPAKGPAVEESPKGSWAALGLIANERRGVGPAALTRETRAISESVLHILPAAGGCGATTIMANLAAVFSSAGERLLLVDGARPAVLPNYFGSAGVSGLSTVFGGPRRTTPIHILLAEQDWGEGSEAPDDSWVWDGMARTGAAADRVLIDHGHGMSPALSQSLCAGGLCLIPITPELRAAVAMKYCLRWIADMESRASAKMRAFFVLNQFDARLPLHVDFQHWLQSQLGERLLPSYISRCDLISEALAGGSTVPAYQPDSASTAEFEVLAAWIQSLGNGSGASARRGEGCER